MSDPFAMARLAEADSRRDAGILDLPPPTPALAQQHRAGRPAGDTPTPAEQFAAKLLTIPELLNRDPPQPLIEEVLYAGTLAVLFGGCGCGALADLDGTP